MATEEDMDSLTQPWLWMAGLNSWKDERQGREEGT